MSMTEALLGQQADDLFVSVASVPDAKELQALDVEGQLDARQAIATAIRNAQRLRASPGSRIALVKGEVGSGKTHVLTTALQQAAGQASDEVYPIILQLTAPVTRETYERWLLQASFREFGARHFSNDSAPSPLRRLAKRLLEKVPSDQAILFRQLFQDASDERELMAVAMGIGATLREQAFDIVNEDPPGAGFIATVLLAGFGDWSALNYLRRSHIDDRIEPLGVIPVDTPVDRLMMLKDLGMTAQIVGASLAIGFDQVENAVRLGDENLFVHALVQGIRIAESVLNVAILIAVLADEYDRIASGTEQNTGLAAGDLYRIERELPSAVRLERPSSDFLRRVVAQRLSTLWEREAVDAPPGELDPLPDWFRPRVQDARSVRDALREVNRLREKAARLGRLPSQEELGLDVTESAPATLSPAFDFDKMWADHRDGGTLTLEAIPAANKANLLAWWAREASEERRSGAAVEVTQGRAEDEFRTHLVDVTFRDEGKVVEQRVIGLCEAPNRNQKLSTQLQSLLDRDGGMPIAVRTKGFPKGSNTQPAAVLKELAKRGGLQLDLGEIEWHALQEAKVFADVHRPKPDFLEWRRDRQWLLQLIPDLSPILSRR